MNYRKIMIQIIAKTRVQPLISIRVIKISRIIIFLLSGACIGVIGERGLNFLHMNHRYSLYEQLR